MSSKKGRRASRAARGEFVWVIDGKTLHPARLVLPKDLLESNATRQDPVEVQWTQTGFFKTVPRENVQFNDGRRARRSSVTAKNDTSKAPAKRKTASNASTEASVTKSLKTRSAKESPTKKRLLLDGSGTDAPEIKNIQSVSEISKSNEFSELSSALKVPKKNSEGTMDVCKKRRLEKQQDGTEREQSAKKSRNTELARPGLSQHVPKKETFTAATLLRNPANIPENNEVSKKSEDLIEYKQECLLRQSTLPETIEEQNALPDLHSRTPQAQPKLTGLETMPTQQSTSQSANTAKATHSLSCENVKPKAPEDHENKREEFLTQHDRGIKGNIVKNIACQYESHGNESASSEERNENEDQAASNRAQHKGGSGTYPLSPAFQASGTVPNEKGACGVESDSKAGSGAEILQANDEASNQSTADWGDDVANSSFLDSLSWSSAKGLVVSKFLGLYNSIRGSSSSH